MAVQKSVNSKSTNSGSNTNEYQYQKFGAKAVALIKKHNLTGDDNYKKLLSSFEKINVLPKSDARRSDLVNLWEDEFNRLFMEFWNSKFVKKQTDNGKSIDGWKNRLNIEETANNIDAKRQEFLSRSTPGGSNFGSLLSRKSILQRAGYNTQTSNLSFNFTAQGKSSSNLKEIESMLEETNREDDKKVKSILSGAETKTLKKSKFAETDEQSALYDVDGNLVKANVDPELEAFVNGGSKSKISKKKAKMVEEKPVINSQAQQITRAIYEENNSSKQENEFAEIRRNRVTFEDEKIDFDNLFDSSRDSSENTFEMIGYVEEDTPIDPTKRNILTKTGFEINNLEESDAKQIYNFKNGEFNEEEKKIFRQKLENEVQYFDPKHRSSMKEIMATNKRELDALDEMSDKIEFLRDLRNERRHRLNMLKMEKANSYIVSRSRKLAEERELKRIKKREDLNLRVIANAEKQKRLIERQKLVSLMKERHLKRAEEKRVASILRLEREARLENDAKYRSEIASLDAQIKHEQELLKRTEFKMKSYFSKNSTPEEFEKSLLVAKNTIKNGKDLELKEEKILMLEDKKRQDRIEKISRKFNKNVK